MRYSFSSTLRSICAGCCQFWPNIAPIIRAQVLAAHSAIADLLDQDALLNWHGPIFAAPLSKGGARHLDSRSSSRLLTAIALDQPINRFKSFTHARIVGIAYMICKALPIFF